jgi:hypothetical protein
MWNSYGLACLKIGGKSSTVKASKFTRLRKKGIAEPLYLFSANSFDNIVSISYYPFGVLGKGLPKHKSLENFGGGRLMDYKILFKKTSNKGIQYLEQCIRADDDRHAHLAATEIVAIMQKNDPCQEVYYQLLKIWNIDKISTVGVIEIWSYQDQNPN